MVLRDTNRTESLTQRQQRMDCHYLITVQDFQPSLRRFPCHKPLASELPRNGIPIGAHDDITVPRDLPSTHDGGIVGRNDERLQCGALGVLPANKRYFSCRAVDPNISHVVEPASG